MSKLNITDSKKLDILTHYNGRCAYCGRYDPLTIDHLTPICKGGTGRYHNLVPACADCNQAKDSMTVEEFRKEISVRKHMSILNEALREPFQKLWPWHWYRTLKKFEDTCIEFWMDKH